MNVGIAGQCNVGQIQQMDACGFADALPSNAFGFVQFGLLLWCFLRQLQRREPVDASRNERIENERS